MEGYCYTCNNNCESIVEEKTIHVKVKDIYVDACIKVLKCKKCGEELYNKEFEKENDISIYDEYKKTKGLLTSKELISLRKANGLSQRELARLMKIGEKDITRYENGSIQTPSVDLFLKLVLKNRKILDIIKNSR